MVIWHTVKIHRQLLHDNAIQSPTGTGIGTAVGRTLGTVITGVI
jgi:hypothetical protein